MTLARPPIVCLIGPHGAGKTTVGRQLAFALRAAWFPEIGRQLREEARALDANRHILSCDAGFDRRVITAELSRDARLPSGAVVETWHPGNLAYGELRSPAVVAELLQACAQSCAAVGPVVVQPLTASREVLARRLTEPGGSMRERLDFFRAVADRAFAWARRLDLRVLPAIDTGATTPRGCVRAIRRRLHAGALWR